MKYQTAYFNDRIKKSKKRDKTFLGGYKIEYRDNFVEVRVLGKRVIVDSIYYLIALPPNYIIKREVSESQLYLK